MAYRAKAWEEAFMVGIILITENKEATEMLRTTRRLLGNTKGIMTVTLKPGRPVEKMKAAVRSAIQKINTHEGTLLLTDIYGSTQCNVCMNFVKKGSIELLTGFNLPMLVKLATLHEKMPFKELLPFIKDYGKEQIRHVTKKV